MNNGSKEPQKQHHYGISSHKNCKPFGFVTGDFSGFPWWAFEFLS